MAYGTQFPDLYSFETKQGVAAFAFDAKTGQIATPGLISGMLPGALKAAFSLSQRAAKEFGYAEAMQARNAAAIEAYTAPALETPNTSLSVYSSPNATASFDAATGEASISGAFASMDLGQQGFGQVGFDLGALAEAMGPAGTVGSLGFTDYQDAAISGTLGHGPLGFDAINEEEALAEDLEAGFSAAGLGTSANMADAAGRSAGVSSAFAEAFGLGVGMDFSSKGIDAMANDPLSGMDIEMSNTPAAASSLGYGFANAAKNNAETFAVYSAIFTDLQAQRDFDPAPTTDMAAEVHSMAKGPEGIAARAEIEQQKAADFVASLEDAGQAAAMDYNSQAPNFDVVEAMQNLGLDYISMNAFEMQAEKYALALEIAAIKTARGEGPEGFSGMEGATGSFSEGFGSMSAQEAQEAYDRDPMSGFEDMSGFADFGGYGNIGDAEGVGHDAGADQTGATSSADPESNEGSDSPDGPGGDSDCFVQGTLVLMAEGSTKAIEKVVVGDLVAGKDGNANTVKATHIKKPDIPFLYGFNGHKPFVTAYHPFMTKEGWGCFEPEKFKEHRPTAYQEIANEQGGKDLIKIKNNCEILRSDNEWVLVEDIVVEGCDPNLTVYNLSVANDKTFVANNYIVHNKGDGDSKIICTAMNNMYGFGSYRNALWMKYQSSHMAAEEYELGYHKLFMPLVNKMPTNKYIKVFLERVAKNRTVNLRKEMRGQKTGIEYKLFKYAVRPLFFVVGWLVKKKILSKTEV
tara:strand:- start:2510 stop:4747 length:2238 start_codon:yes stop_codon:yes gene_type:complete